MLRRGIVLVHGIGEQPPGDTLNYMGRPLVTYLQEHLDAKQAPHVFDADYTAEGEPPHAVIRFGDGNQEEEWLLTEAWWARSFLPVKQDEVLVWAFALGARRIWVIFYGLALRPLVDTATFRQIARLLKPVLPLLEALYLDAARGAEPWPNTPFWYRRPKRRLRSRVGDVLVATLWLPIMLGGWLLSAFIVPVLLFLGYVPGLGGLVGQLQKLFAGFLMGNLGDQHSTTRNLLARNAASRTVLDALAPWLDSIRADHKNVATVTIIAHSGGAVVAFDAVTNGQLGRWLTELSPNAPAVTLFTVGSGLNAAYTMNPEEAFWRQAFPANVRWIDLWAKYDPISGGPAPPDIARLAGCDHFVDLRVSNTDNPLEDHDGYFANKEEVMCRILFGILGLEGGQPAQSRLIDRAEADFRNGDRHRLAVGLWSAARLAVATAVGVLALRTELGPAAGQLMLSLLPDPAESKGLLPEVLRWARSDAGLPWVSAAVLWYTTYSLWRLAELLLNEAKGALLRLAVLVLAPLGLLIPLVLWWWWQWLTRR